MSTPPHWHSATWTRLDDDLEAQQALLAAALSANHTALQALGRYLDGVIRAALGSLVFHYARQGQDVRRMMDDVVQDIALLCLEDQASLLRKWDPKRGSLESYIKGIAWNKCRERLRKKIRRERTMIHLGNEVLENAEDSMLNPEEKTSIWNELQQVRQELVQIEGQSNVDIFDSVKVEGLSIARVAEENQMEPKEIETILARLSRRAKFIRERLSESAQLQQDHPRSKP